MIDFEVIGLMQYNDIEDQGRLKTPTYEDVKAFIQADDEKKRQRLAKKYSEITPRYNSIHYEKYPDSLANLTNEEILKGFDDDDPTADSVECTRFFLMLALETKDFIAQKAASAKDLEHLGVVTRVFNAEEKIPGQDISFSDLCQRNKELYAKYPMENKNKKGSEYFCDHLSSENDIFTASWMACVNSAPYLKYLTAGCECARNSGFSCEIIQPEDDCGILDVSIGTFSNTHDGRLQCIELLLDALCTIHLHDVVSSAKHGGIPYQECNSLISSLWLCMMQDYCRGRVGRCVVCGKPFIAFSERANKRLYCSDACSKWSQRHPGEPR